MEWEMFDAMDPIGERRGDIRAGIIASTYANTWRGKDKKPFTVGDFIPRFDQHLVVGPQPSKRSVQKKIMDTFLGMGAIDNRKQ